MRSTSDPKVTRESIELVINSLKHAFDETTKDGAITVACDVSATDWQLVVSDNGFGKPDCVFAQPKAGLGAGVVKALARQLDAQVVTVSGAMGTKVFGYSRDVCGPLNLRRPNNPRPRFKLNSEEKFLHFRNCHGLKSQRLASWLGGCDVRQLRPDPVLPEGA